MKKIEENFGYAMRGDFTRNIPFYGSKGDFNFALGRSKFSPGISIKQVPLSDLSVKGDPGFSDFDIEHNLIKSNYRIGSRVRGIKVNSHLGSDSAKMVVGKLHKIQPEYSGETLRVWIKDPKTLKIIEVYPETIERLYESHLAMTFAQFINS